MERFAPDFSLDVQGVKGVCPAGEVYAKQLKGADKVIMIDGCFLLCHGRILKKLTAEEKVVHIDALPLYKKYTDIFLMDDVPEHERKAVAREVADKIIARLKDEGVVMATAAQKR